jgi:hypothetical protein
MKLLPLVSAAIFMLVLSGSVQALGLVELSVYSVYLETGKSLVLKIYVKNPDVLFENITVQLEGDYPSDKATLSGGAGFLLSPDRRTAVIGLNPGVEKILDLVIVSVVPDESGYIINVSSSSTSGTSEVDTLDVMVAYPVEQTPGFPGLDVWALLAVFLLSGMVYWKLSLKK